MTVNQLAVVIKPRGQEVLLECVNGITYDEVFGASKQAIDNINKYYSENRNGDLERSGQGAPLMNLGYYLVNHGRHQVVYRMVDSVFVVLVVGAASNQITASNILNVVCQILIKLCRGVEVAAQQLQQQYDQVYLALSAVVRAGCRDTYAALTHASSVVDMLGMRDDKNKGKNKPDISQTNTQPPVPRGNRTLGQSKALFKSLNFSVPAESVSVRSTQSQAPLPTQTATPATPPEHTTSAARASESWLPSVPLYAKPSEVPEGALQPSATQSRDVNVGLQQVLAAAGAPLPTAAPKRPCQCRELWRGSYVGQSLKRVGLKGNVSIAHGAKETVLALKLCGDYRDKVLMSSLRNAYANQGAIKSIQRTEDCQLIMQVRQGIAQNNNSNNNSTCSLRYIVPATVLAPPAVVTLFVMERQGAQGIGGLEKLFHIRLRVMLHPHLQAVDERGVRVCVTLPPSVGRVTKLSHPAQFHASTRELRTRIRNVSPARPLLFDVLTSPGLMTSALSVAGVGTGSGAAMACMGMSGNVRFSSQYGQTWSGLRLFQEVNKGMMVDVTNNACHVAVDVDVTPIAIERQTGDGAAQAQGGASGAGFGSEGLSGFGGGFGGT